METTSRELTDGEPDAVKVASPVRKGGSGNLREQGALPLPYKMLPCEGAKAQRQKVPRRRKAPARPADPSRAEVAAAPLVDALCDPDEQRRQANAAHVLRACFPAVVALLCR